MKKAKLMTLGVFLALGFAFANFQAPNAYADGGQGGGDGPRRPPIIIRGAAAGSVETKDQTISGDDFSFFDSLIQTLFSIF